MLRVDAQTIDSIGGSDAAVGNCTKAELVVLLVVQKPMQTSKKILNLRCRFDGEVSLIVENVAADDRRLIDRSGRFLRDDTVKEAL